MSTFEEETSGEAEKTCPMCGEMIKAVARKCRYCGEVLEPGIGGAFDQQVEEAAKRAIKENQDKTTALQLFITGLIGCFSPILVFYGIVFLLRRPSPFPRKGLAIAGTILHGIWSGLWVVWIIGSVVLAPR